MGVKIKALINPKNEKVMSYLSSRTATAQIREQSDVTWRVFIPPERQCLLFSFDRNRNYILRIRFFNTYYYIICFANHIKVVIE